MSSYIATQALEEFIETFDPEGQIPWDTLITEEAEEVREALANLMKELSDLAYVVTGAYIAAGEAEEFTNDDTRMFVVGASALAEAIDTVIPGLMSSAFLEVHRSNMSKTGDDGKPIRRVDGKILKGPNYYPANIIQFIPEAA